jgi:hypothetical protein
MKLVSELKRRNVFRAAAFYWVAAWLLMQVGEVTFGPLHFPDWAMTLLVIVLITGFPIAMVLSWFFEFNLRGFKGDSALFLKTDEVVDASTTEPSPDELSIAVLSFDDMSPHKDQQYLCDGIAEEILNKLAQSWHRFRIYVSPPAPHLFGLKHKQLTSMTSAENSESPQFSKAAFAKRAINYASPRSW